MGNLTEEQKQFYKDNGYILLKNLIPEEELNLMSEEYDSLFARKNQQKMESSWVGSDSNDRKSDSPFTDYHYFPYEKDSMVAAFLHLDAADPQNGGLYVYPGSHKLGPLEDFGAKVGNFHFVDQAAFPLDKATPVVAERGDVVIFSYFLVHGSSVNVSSRPRRMFLAQLASADDAPVGTQPLRPGQGWLLRGVNVERDASISKRFEAS